MPYRIPGDAGQRPIAPGIPPFRLMDRVGLDVVLNIEEHYAAVRKGLPEAPRRLLRGLIDQGRLRREGRARVLPVRRLQPNEGRPGALVLMSRRRGWSLVGCSGRLETKDDCC